LYIPLGGSRVSKWKVVRNTFAIFLVSGFWHGANWTFIAWGAFHAFLFLPEILAGKNRKYTNTVAEGKMLPSIKEFFQMGLTFALVVIGWIFFRAETIGDAINYLGGICNKSLLCMPRRLGSIKATILSIVLMLIIEWINRNNQHALETFGAKWKPVFRYVLYYGLILLIFFFSGKEETFIYFQF
jgi:D-alanyl-lipoteichoic acid acyltransferase DltB (MBOAT superfamily)